MSFVSMSSVVSTDEDVPIGTGPPTREELRVHYPPKFTWDQLKIFINAGDLGLLKRDKRLQSRYMTWMEGIKEQYGSALNYILNYRLRWGKPDRISLLTSEIVECTPPNTPPEYTNDISEADYSSHGSVSMPTYFTADIPSRFISIIQNDWPYSVPLDVEHTLVWTRAPILPPPTLVPPHVASALPEDVLRRVTSRLEQDGVWGFTGICGPPPSPSHLPQSLGALSEWGVTMDKLIISPSGSTEEEEAVKMAGDEVSKYVKNRWKEDDWETAWFVNPPRLQSVKDLAHIHVFAKKKKKE